MRSNAAPLFGVAPFLDVDTRRPLTKTVLFSLDLESRFYAVLSKAASKWPSVKSTPIEVPGTETAKRHAKVFVISRKDRNGILTPGRYIMNEFTDKKEKAFLDACGAISVEAGWKLKSCITLTQRRYGHPEGVNLTTLMRGSHDPGVAAPHCDRYGHVEGIDPRKKVADEAIVVR
jgi:hypothetical protein